MTWRGPVVLGCLLVLGAGGGFGVSMAMADHSAGGGAAAPVAAQSPSLPVDPEPSLLPDPATPALPVELDLRRVTFGVAGFGISYPVPKGWIETRSVNDAKWRAPDHVDFGYLLRVEQVGQNRTIERTMQDRIRDLDLDEEGFQVTEQTTDTLRFTYIVSQHRRFGLLRWLDLGSGFADVEISVSGRSVDLPGMEALLERVADGVRPA
jgi:hypothetical protein